MTNSPSEIVRVLSEETHEAGFEDMLPRATDVSKIHRPIGYQPVLDLPEAPVRTIAYVQKREPSVRPGAG